MLHRVKPSPSNAAADPFRPDFIAPLLAPGLSAPAITHAMVSIINSFEFESFINVLATAPHMGVESQIYFWTNQPREWIEIYDQRSFIEIDPRPALSESQVTPLVWDTSTIPNRSEYKQFLAEASRFGICSGVVIPVPDSEVGRAGLSLHSSIPKIGRARQAKIRDNLGDLMLLAVYIHQIFMRAIIEMRLQPIHKGAPLSRREVQCLALAAQGMRGSDIARCLEISERTVQFHFSNVNSKFGSATRAEAIAYAARNHLISL